MRQQMGLNNITQSLGRVTTLVTIGAIVSCLVVEETQARPGGRYKGRATNASAVDFELDFNAPEPDPTDNFFPNAIRNFKFSFGVDPGEDIPDPPQVGFRLGSINASFVEDLNYSVEGFQFPDRGIRYRVSFDPSPNNFFGSPETTDPSTTADFYLSSTDSRLLTSPPESFQLPFVIEYDSTIFRFREGGRGDGGGNSSLADLSRERIEIPDTEDPDTEPVPEPSLFLGAGALGGAMLMKRRRAKKAAALQESVPKVESV